MSFSVRLLVAVVSSIDRFFVIFRTPVTGQVRKTAGIAENLERQKRFEREYSFLLNDDCLSDDYLVQPKRLSDCCGNSDDSDHNCHYNSCYCAQHYQNGYCGLCGSGNPQSSGISCPRLRNRLANRPLDPSKLINICIIYDERF